MAVLKGTTTGTGQGLIFNDTGRSNAAFLPAAKGSQISFYFTGAGTMLPAGIDGKINSASGTGPVLPVAVSIDGVPCDLIFVGNALGEVSGMMQATVRVPSSGVRSATIPLQLTVGGVTSQPGVVVAIQ